MYELKIGDIISGFTVKTKEALPDIEGTMYEMEYEKCGARLVFLDRDDENKTFSVGFKTIPTDSTGVFHIIEHSVLCGSEKFPVKEPFVELLKSSLQTFLNAMTFPDKTLYPVSSRNDKDFFNLADVYLDAVFNPLMKTHKNIFLQEGWRRDISEGGELSYNGVVFNEMKGAYSSPEELGEATAASMLYGESCYGCDSGGCPAEIPKLSYEGFVASHAKFYHPSNAYFFLDGRVKLEESLALIESYISSYEKLPLDVDIEDTWSGKASSSEIEYEISSEESEENKSRLVISYLSTRFDETLENLALDIVVDAISSGNESPVKKALLESGLCEKMGIYVNNSRLRNNISVEFQNVKDGKAEEAEALFIKTLRGLVDEGINREHLASAINHLEFVLRERDMGGLPVGVAYNISIFDTWLYGGSPAAPLCYSESFKKLRELLDSDYFEELIRKYILENEKYARVLMRPSATLGERRARSEREAYACEKEALSEEEIKKITEESKALFEWQNSEDSEIALASLPALEISDIPKVSARTPIETERCGDVEIIRHDMKTGGITYTELFFDASDTIDEEMYLLPLLAAFLKSSGTVSRDAFSFQNLIKRELGSLTLAAIPVKKAGEVRVYVKLGVSMLDAKKKEFIEILKEFLYSSELKDRNTLGNIVRQSKLMLESGFTSAGDSYGFVRSLASKDSQYAMLERLSGYEFYKKIKDCEKNFDDLADALTAKLSALKDKIFIRERLTLSIAGAPDTELEKEILKALKPGSTRPDASRLSLLPETNEGIAIPSQVGFGVMTARLSEIGRSVTGAMSVARVILNYEHLWSAVRVKGGAYGVALRVRRDGSLGYTSYRDPTPEKSLEAFRASAEFLRSFANGERDLTKYIIGAMGEFEPLRSIPLEASLSTSNYLSGYSEEERERLRREILETDKSALLAVAETLEELNSRLTSLLVAPKEKLGGCETILYI